MSVKLSAATLAHMPPGVAVPKYKRADLKPGIVHIGVGNFHRAHQAVYLDDLFNLGVDRDFAIVGAGVREPDADMRAKLGGAGLADHRRRAGGRRVIRPRRDRRDDRLPQALRFATMLATLADPEIRIVSLTVTEGGYYISPATQNFDPTHPDIVADAKRMRTPRRPPSASSPRA